MKSTKRNNIVMRVDVVSQKGVSGFKGYIYDQKSRDYLHMSALSSKKEIEELYEKYKPNKVLFNPYVENSLGAPIKIYVDITSRCNLKCKHCFNGKVKIEELSIEEIDKIQNYCNEYGVFEIKIGGGEPFLHSDIMYCLDKLCDNGRRISLTSNGTVYNEEICKRLKKYKVKFSISLDGNQKVHDAIRGNGCYLKVISNIDKYIEYGVNPVLKYTINDINYEFEVIDEVVKLCETKGLKLHLKFVKPMGNASGICKCLSKENVKRILERYRENEHVYFSDEYENYESIRMLEYSCGEKRCAPGMKSIHINYRGEVRGCVFIPDEIFTEPFKTIKENELGDIWNTDGNLRFMRNLPLPVDCMECSNYCKNICFAYRYCLGGNLLGENPICIKNLK